MAGPEPAPRSLSGRPSWRNIPTTTNKTKTHHCVGTTMMMVVLLLLSTLDTTKAWSLPRASSRPTMIPSSSSLPSSPLTSVRQAQQQKRSSPLLLAMKKSDRHVMDEQEQPSHESRHLWHRLPTSIVSTAVAFSLSVSLWWTQAPSTAMAATDPGAIVTCLLQKCRLPLAQCIANPKCLANVVCINSCNGRPDEIDCQIECGNLWENDVVGVFNKCAVSDMSCVPQQSDDGSYPVPSNDVVVPTFNTNMFNGRWYITAGQNKLFDIFPCQVHFFEETEPGKFFGKLNWRVEEPDGEFFTRDALQSFYQDPNQPSHLINHDNEYLHYKDDWWIIDYEYDNNKDGVPPFAFVYYRGSNDAWDGYGGVVVYTRAAALPQSIVPRLRVAAQKVGFDFDKDFTATDNSCPTDLSAQEKVLLREKFAGKVILQTEQQLQAEATKVRGNAANSIKAQKLFFEERSGSAQRAFSNLNQNAKDFEQEIIIQQQQQAAQEKTVTK